MKLEIKVDLKKNHDPFEEIKWILKDLAKSDKTESIGKFAVYDSNGDTVGSGRIHCQRDETPASTQVAVYDEVESSFHNYVKIRERFDLTDPNKTAKAFLKAFAKSIDQDTSELDSVYVKEGHLFVIGHFGQNKVDAYLIGPTAWKLARQMDKKLEEHDNDEKCLEIVLKEVFLCL